MRGIGFAGALAWGALVSLVPAATAAPVVFNLPPIPALNVGVAVRISFCTPTPLPGRLCGGPFVRVQQNPRGGPGTHPIYAFTLKPGAGVLPPGLLLNARTGMLSGTPSEAGVFPVQICARVGVAAAEQCRPTVMNVFPNVNGAWNGNYTGDTTAFGCSPQSQLNGALTLNLQLQQRNPANASTIAGTVTLEGLPPLYNGANGNVPSNNCPLANQTFNLNAGPPGAPSFQMSNQRVTAQGTIPEGVPHGGGNPVTGEWMITIARTGITGTLYLKDVAGNGNTSMITITAHR